MSKSSTNKEKFMLDKLLILLAVICVTLGILIIALYLDNAEISIFAKNTDKIIETYASTEDTSIIKAWDLSVTENGNAIATLSEDGTLTISGTGEMKGWTNIGNIPWYIVRDQIKSVKFSGAVTSIGNNAFYECEKLTKIEIPSSITSIKYGVFSGCTSLTSIEIPSSVTSIETSAFSGCTSLAKIEVDENNTEYKDHNGVLYNKDGTQIIKYPEGKTEEKYIILGSTTTIGYRAFEGCPNLISIEIPRGVTSINDYAFLDCTSLINIKIPDSVTSIGDGVFVSCECLANIEIPSSVTYIGNNPFSNCQNLNNINVDTGNMKYKDENGILYSRDGTEIIVYPEGKKETEYKILSGVITIKKSAFSGCRSLTNIEIPSSVTSIENGAFKHCTNLTEIEIPISVSIIDAWVFYGCTSLANIKIPNSVTNIKNNAFYECESLTKIKIPSSVTSIGYMAFSNCTSLTIICKSGTVAETYAKENNITYQLIHLGSIEQEIDEINLMIKNIQPQTTMQEFKSDLSSDIAYIILDSKGNEIHNALTIIGTGCQIKLDDNTIYTIIITGDADGDGQANIDDILAINKYRLKKAPLTSEYLQAADVDGNGVADISDILQINKFRLGKTQTL